MFFSVFDTFLVIYPDGCNCCSHRVQNTTPDQVSLQCSRFESCFVQDTTLERADVSKDKVNSESS